MRKLLLLAAVAVGYVLGARAGRERYEEIMRLANRVKNDPRVQEKAHQAVDVAKQQAPVVADKVTGKVSDTVGSKVGGRQPAHHMAGPQGDLP